LETFELHHDSYWPKRRDGGVSKEEWASYYRTISWLIDSDDYFNLVLNAVWDLQATENPYKKYEKGYYPDAS
jgi:hypothetical protein